MSTIINNISFDITNLTITRSAPSINIYGHTPQYSNMNSTIEMTATTSSSNYGLLMDWCDTSKNDFSLKYKFDTIHNGFFLKGVFPNSIQYNSSSNYIDVEFSVDYTYTDDSAIKDFKKEQERKKRKEKLKKLNEICKS